MKEFKFTHIDNYMNYKFKIPLWYYRIRFRKVKNKNLYYLTFVDYCNQKIY